MALIASVCSAQVPTLRSTPQKPGLGPRSRVGMSNCPTAICNITRNSTSWL